MRRRLVDMAGAAVGAVLLAAVLRVVLVYGAAVTLPRTWSPGEILTAADLNANYSAIVAQVNGGLDNSNIAPGAAISGSKLGVAPDGITTAQVNDQAVTLGKLAVGASISTSVDASATSGAVGTTETVVVDSTFATRGGAVIGVGAYNATAVDSTSDTAAAIRVRVRLDGTAATADGTILRDIILSSRPGAGMVGGLTFALPFRIPTLVSGNHRLKVTVQDTLSTGTRPIVTGTVLLTAWEPA